MPQAVVPRARHAVPQWAIIPNNPAIATALAAIFKGGPNARSLIGGWFEDEDGKPIYRHSGNRGGKVLVYVDPVTTAAGSVPTAEDVWGFIDGLSAFTADVALAVLAQLCEPSLANRPKYPLVESVPISADAILAYKGIRRWGAERRVLRARVCEEMERLRGLRFDVERYPAWDPELRRWNPMGVSTKGDRLFDIVAVEQREPQATNGQARLETSWLVRAGHWAYWWMNAQGRVWISRMSRALLEMDHRANRGSAVLAKKIGQHTTLLSGALRGQTTLVRRIDRLLSDVGELPVPAARGGHWAGRVRDRFDEAMQALVEAAVFTTVDWPDGYGPGDADRGKGWVAPWLAAKVVISMLEPPTDLSPVARVSFDQKFRQSAKPSEAPEQCDSQPAKGDATGNASPWRPTSSSGREPTREKSR